MNSTSSLLLLTSILSLVSLQGCAAGNAEVFYEDEDSISDDTDEALEDQQRSRRMTAAQRADRLAHIRTESVNECLSSGWAIAGVAQSETRLAHCYSERDSQACKGPYSAECGGAVIAGYWDGPAGNRCGGKQGGLGMFQFDGGTHTQTVSREGRRILTVEGSTEAAFEFIGDIVARSRFISGVANQTRAIEWIGSLRMDSTNYKNYIKTLVVYYNGCDPDRAKNPCSRSTYNARYEEYDRSMREVFNETGGQTYWDLTEAERSLCPANGF